jgi:hypothetical protein
VPNSNEVLKIQITKDKKQVDDSMLSRTYIETDNFGTSAALRKRLVMELEICHII